jgi:hypothetical protein
MIFDPKISTLEETVYLDSISMDEIHGIFTTYEMRTGQENPDIKKKLSKHPKGQSKRKKNIAAAVTFQNMMKKWPTLSKE